MQRGSETTCRNSSVQCSRCQPTLLFTPLLGLIEQQWAAQPSATNMSFPRVSWQNCCCRTNWIPVSYQTAANWAKIQRNFSNKQKVWKKTGEEKLSCTTNFAIIQWIASSADKGHVAETVQVLKKSTVYSFFRLLYFCSRCRFLHLLRLTLSSSTSLAIVYHCVLHVAWHYHILFSQ